MSADHRGPGGPSILQDVWQILVPARRDRDGVLPPLLLGLTFVTGLVDAYSYLRLGHVFVANMTGNVVFFAFGLAGSTGFSIGASLTALGAFAVGAGIGGRLGQSLGHTRERLLAVTALLEAALTFSALGLSVTSHPWQSWVHYVLIVLLAVALGLQNATARRLAVPDLTTTVLTLTITGVAADSRAAGGQGSHVGRRAVAIVTMALGALVGSVLTLKVGLELPLLVAGLVLVCVVVSSILWSWLVSPGTRTEESS